MIIQDLWNFDARSVRRAPYDWGALWRRFLVFGGALFLTVMLASFFYKMLSLGGMTFLQWGLLTLFCINILWLSLSFMTAIAGFLTTCFRASSSVVDVRAAGDIESVRGRTAILIPTYNEAPDRIFGAALAVDRSLSELGTAGNFDIFVLSDTTDPDIWVQEETAFAHARRYFGGGRNLFYRRRSKNTGKKAGNVAEWCTRHVNSYDYMIVFDADSLMTGETLISMADALDRHEDTALLQTVPQCFNQKTIFARMQQFAGQVYGKILSRGIAFWHRGEGNFWGHNAIIRVKAFHDCCGLPELSGRAPFGGSILSHDFVEAALLRRAGWRVSMAPELGGSYEESPPSLLDFAARDRRWCQGNLQHSKVIGAKGLHWVNRVHLATGIMSYMSTMVWLLFLTFGLVITLQAQFQEFAYFGSTHSLFPNWPRQDSETALLLLCATFTLLLLPKFLGYLTVMLSREGRRSFGGGIRLTLSVVLETVVSSLLAPIMMLMQSAAIVEIISGRDGGWGTQSREDGIVPTLFIFQAHALHMLIGIGGAVLCYAVSWSLLLWMSPVLAGLVLSAPLSLLTSHRATGEFFQRLKIFAIPEEQTEPQVLVDARVFRCEIAERMTGGEAILSLATNPDLNALHKNLLGHQERLNAAEIHTDLAVARAKLEAASSLGELIGSLTPREKTALLSDSQSLHKLQTVFFAQVAANSDASQVARREAS